MSLEIGDTIRAIREAKGLTLAEVVERMKDGSVAALSSWELNNAKPDLDRLVALCTALEVSADKVLGLSNESLNLTTEEEEVILGLRWVDRRGRQEVLDCLEINKERCNYFVLEGAVEVHLPFFIHSDHPDYERNMRSCRDLRKLQRKNRVSAEDIFHYLARVSPVYGDHLCLAYIFAVLRGKRCPSTELYGWMYRACVEGSAKSTE